MNHIENMIKNIFFKINKNIKFNYIIKLYNEKKY
jgi:hypothetical protein